MIKRIALIVASMVFSSAAIAQDPAQFQKLTMALDKAQQEAIREGDEKLDCPALEQQLVEQVTAPAVQDYAVKAGQAAQRTEEQGKPNAAKMTGQAALAAFSSLAPGGAWAGIMTAAGQIPGMAVQTAQNIEQRMQQSNEMIKILPQLLRGQRVIELAQTRKCEWLPAEVMQGSPPESIRK